MDSFHTYSNFKPFFLAMHSFWGGNGVFSAKTRHLYLPALLQYWDKIEKHSWRSNLLAGRSITEAIPLLCIHPVAVELKAVRETEETLLFDGDNLLGYTVYSARGLLQFLES